MDLGDLDPRRGEASMRRTSTASQRAEDRTTTGAQRRRMDGGLRDSTALRARDEPPGAVDARLPTSLGRREAPGDAAHDGGPRAGVRVDSSRLERSTNSDNDFGNATTFLLARSTRPPMRS